jgi:hypothetical protein
VEPNNTVQTSPARLADCEKMFMIRYPTASEPAEIIASAASPLIFAFCPERSRKTALSTVTGSTRR